MILRHELVLLPEEAADRQVHRDLCAVALRIDAARICDIVPVRRSIDARGRQVRIRLLADVYVDEAAPPAETPSYPYRHVTTAPAAVIAGSGPAGLFAALRLLESGVRPIILERGYDVRRRRRDLALISREGKVDSDSNYCFGEGGAGTYSDGKLYTRSTKRGDVRRILRILVAHGADPDICVDAHPHIGTNKLPAIIENIRRTITGHGGEFRFGRRLTDFTLRNGRLCAVTTTDTATGDTDELETSCLLLATGHSARDIFEMLCRKGLHLEAKPFALGVRIEHPQHIIDAAQYHLAPGKETGPWLPPASYSLRHDAAGRGVFSFCMCPGGIIAPAATAEGEIVVNGWSPSRRNNPFANSGIVASVGDADFAPYRKDGALQALRYQQKVEQSAFAAGGGRLRAPAQRMLDFVHRKSSPDIPATSYHPGVTAAILDDVLPPAITAALRASLAAFGKMMKGYASNEAVLVGVESRTSSPVRIPRDNDSLQHPQAEGVFPCGEGAGYAGGIVSAAMDGERCAEKMAAFILH